MKFLVIGGGSIGQRHIQNILSLGHTDIEFYDVDKNNVKKIAKKYSVKPLYSLTFNNPDCSLICTSPNTHIEIAKKCLENKSHVFIEKPLSNSRVGISTISKLAKKRRLQIFVGYVFRFDKGLKKINENLQRKIIGNIISYDAYEGWFLPNWRPWQDFTKSYTSLKKLGGGIILDGSHEVNYLVWLGGKIDQVFAYYRTIPKMKVETEGLAEILLKFKSKAIGRIHLDFINPKYNRHCEIIGDKGSIRWFFEDQSFEIHKNDKNTFDKVKYGKNFNDMYINEIKHVINTINKKEKNSITLIDAIQTLEISLAIKKSGIVNRPIFLNM